MQWRVRVFASTHVLLIIAKQHVASERAAAESACLRPQRWETACGAYAARAEGQRAEDKWGWPKGASVSPRCWFVGGCLLRACAQSDWPNRDIDLREVAAAWWRARAWQTPTAPSTAACSCTSRTKPLLVTKRPRRVLRNNIGVNDDIIECMNVMLAK